MSRHPSRPMPSVLFLLTAAVSAPVASFAAGPAAGRTGEQIYRADCARCHGAQGEGTEESPRPLAGNKSVAQLAALIDRTMPDDDPGACLTEDARKVAEYIDAAFYSPSAQARNVPPRRALSRLTVRQYRNTLTDLIGSFRAPAATDGTPGLRGQYFKKKEFKDSDRFLDRTDPGVHFDFGLIGPGPEIDDTTKFEVRWTGSVLATETGEYTFLVRSGQAVRLWVNDPKRPLIDAWVKSGTDSTFEATVTLLGGRAYPIRLEFSNIIQGVNDSKSKFVPKAVPASVALEWTPPRRATEVIPARNLSTGQASEVFVVTTPFPPDDRSVGYERGTAISKAWDQAATDAAIEAADSIVEHLPDLSGVSADDPNRAKALREFTARFAARAFRRPLTDGQKALYVDRPFKGTPDLDTAVKRTVLAILKSPRFLYPELGGDGDGGVSDAHDIASRVSFGLWDSLPDPALLEAAAAGRLSTRGDVAREAERRVNDPRTRAKFREFLLQWLRVQPAPDLAKDPSRFPGFDAAVVSDLRTSLELLLEDMIWSGGSDLRRLLLEDGLYVNGRLARVYSIDLPAEAEFRKVKSTNRSGLLTHPYLLANLSYPATSSPIHRGVFVTRSLLGRALRPPPQAVAPLARDLHAELTTRERVTLQTSAAPCLSCHRMINGLGFGLERFDAIGRYRTEEKGHPIDSTGTIEKRDGTVAAFDGAKGLAALLAECDEVFEAFSSQVFHYMINQPVRAYGPRALDDLRRGFAEDGYDVRRLIVRVVVTAALPARNGSTPGRGDSRNSLSHSQ